MTGVLRLPRQVPAALAWLVRAYGQPVTTIDDAIALIRGLPRHDPVGEFNRRT